jgi:DNA helicase-2/ATP-dependent DNA helicase PcrA
MQNLLGELNPEQCEAVKKTEGPCLVIAGAGSGKTKVLTYKVAYLMQENGVKPWNILAITFTNKAANEMKERVQALVGDAINDIWLGTFHSICVRILRKFIDRIGYDHSFVIFDTSDQKTLVKKCLKELNIDPKLFTEKSVITEISNAKNEMLTPEKYAEKFAGDYRKGIISKIYTLYQQRLKKNNAVDFDDIINFTIKILQDNGDILAYYTDKFKYVLVDEYQDTNKAQFMLVSLLASKYGNITVVGDNDQGIYSFRGADISNILNFEKDFPGTKIVKLEQNYRCTGNILKAANAVIKHNESKYDKKLWTENDEGALPYIFCGDDEYEEANFIVEQINHLRTEEYSKYSDFVVLYRMNSQSRAIEDILRRENIPYKIVGGLKFYERKEIKDIIAYLRLISNQSDNLSLTRIINEPKRGVGKTSLDNIENLAIENQTSMYEIIKNADKYIPRIYSNTRDFINVIEELKTLELPVSELIKETLNKTGYTQSLKDEDSVEAETRIENLDEFLTVAMEFEKEAADKSLDEFLQSISLSSDTDELEDNNDMVTLMTLHSAKGLEYQTVFLVGMEEGIFPGYKSMDNPQDLEEERRICYVGITRAKRFLYITFARKRTIFGSTSYNPPSRFIKEIPKELLEGYDDAMEEKSKSDEFEDSNFGWGYGKSSRNSGFGENSSAFGKYGSSKTNITTYKASENDLSKGTGESKYNYRTAESFLASIQAKKNTGVDIAKYKVGQKVYHKKFGNGVITKLEQEADDIKVDIDFEKSGHKRLMAQFAGLEILE